MIIMQNLRRLNPCFSGRWSRRTQFPDLIAVEEVLILVLVEDGLGEQNFQHPHYQPNKT